MDTNASMDIKVRIIVLVLSLLWLCFILRMVKRRKIWERYAIFWVYIGFAVPLDVEERIGHQAWDLVAQLRRADRVGVDEDVGHGGTVPALPRPLRRACGGR